MGKIQKRMRLLIFVIIYIFNYSIGISQQHDFQGIPYLETYARIDTLVTPDRIFLSILITEADTKGKISLEELESKMIQSLNIIGINLEEQLEITDVFSNFKKYFLKQQDVLKSKSYLLKLYDAKTAGNVIVELEKIGISNIELDKTEYSGKDELELHIRTKAVEKARYQAEALLKGLNQIPGKVIFVSDFNTSMYLDVEGRALGIHYKPYDSFTQEKTIDIEFEKIKIELVVKVFFALN